MERACATIGEVALKLKGQYRAVLGASAAYVDDKRLNQEMDTLGLLIKELEDAVVFLQISLEPGCSRDL